MTSRKLSPGDPLFGTKVAYIASQRNIRFTAAEWIRSAKQEHLSGNHAKAELLAFCTFDRNQQDGPAAFTVAIGKFCIVFDMRTITIEDLEIIISHLRDTANLRVVVENSTVLSSVIGSDNVNKGSRIGDTLTSDFPMVYDIELGRELFDGIFGASLLENAAALHVGVNRAKVVLPVSNVKDCSRFADRTHYLQCVYKALRAKFDDNTCAKWLQYSTAHTIKSVATGLKSVEKELEIGFCKDSFVVKSERLTTNFADEVASTAVTRLDEEEELDKLLLLLPSDWAAKVKENSKKQLIDVEMDIGRPPFAFFAEGSKLLLSVNREDVTTERNLDELQVRFEDAGSGVGTDNRAGIDGTLHRISVIRGRNSTEIIGVTLRAGRHIYGVASVLYDVLFSNEHKDDSILLVGPPGSGKTTMSRDVARLLSENKRVIIVDSSDELAGPSLAVHRCVGDARRISVPGGKNQLAETLIEAVQNHTPDVLIADELSNKEEVSGAATAQLRGVRLVSSAHGTMRSLLSNPALRGLLGGVECVTVGDQSTGSGGKNGREKLKSVRVGNPTFNVIVEMGITKGDPTVCRVVPNVREAVDIILSGGKYTCDIRRRGPDGEIMMMKMMA